MREYIYIYIYCICTYIYIYIFKWKLLCLKSHSSHSNDLVIRYAQKYHKQQLQNQGHILHPEVILLLGCAVSWQAASWLVQKLFFISNPAESDTFSWTHHRKLLLTTPQDISTSRVSLRAYTACMVSGINVWLTSTERGKASYQIM